MANAYLDDRAELAHSQLILLLGVVRIDTRFVQGFIFWGRAGPSRASCPLNKQTEAAE